MKIASVVGARPQFIKLAPIIRAIQEHNASDPEPKIEHLIIHTGQHYDYLMNEVFFDELGIPEPNYNLEVGSGTHGYQTGEMIKKIEEVLLKEKPDWVLVYGDTNSTLAGALAAAKLHIPVAHVEAGLRSYNRKMPEELNRLLTDHASSILFCPTETAMRNLQREGFTNIVNEGKLISSDFYSDNSSPDSRLTIYDLPLVINVGDIMYDAMLICFEIAGQKSNILNTYNLLPRSYYLATIHRAENTDNIENLRNIFEALAEISKDKPVIFPAHPRTRKSISALNLDLNLDLCLRLVDPVGYFDMLTLEQNAKKILTDSGGVQKEAYLLGVPCITLREETEWLETIENGWNVLVGTDKEKIVNASKNYFSHLTSHFSPNMYGDGKASERIVKVLIDNIRKDFYEREN